MSALPWPVQNCNESAHERILAASLVLCAKDLSKRQATLLHLKVLARTTVVLWMSFGFGWGQL